MPTLTEQTRKVAQQYRQYWLRGDLVGILSILSADAEYIIFSGATQVLIKDVANYISLGLPSNQLRYIYHDDARVDGDMAFSLYSFVYQSSHTGKQSSARGCDVMTIRDGQIVCVHEYSSFAEVSKASTATVREKIALDEKRLQCMVKDIQDYFYHKQTYLSPDLQLNDLVVGTGYSRNQLSYLFNQVFEESFYSYINAARVNYFIDLIKSDMSANIADIAADSGFNSMTTFYKFFKQKTGLTPKVYIKQLANAQD